MLERHTTTLVSTPPPQQGLLTEDIIPVSLRFLQDELTLGDISPPPFFQTYYPASLQARLVSSGGEGGQGYIVTMVTVIVDNIVGLHIGEGLGFGRNNGCKGALNINTRLIQHSCILTSKNSQVIVRQVALATHRLYLPQALAY